jgi:hypothetical protein
VRVLSCRVLFKATVEVMQTSEAAKERESIIAPSVKRSTGSHRALPVKVPFGVAQVHDAERMPHICFDSR